MTRITEALLRTDLTTIIVESSSVSEIMDKLGIDRTNSSAREKLKQFATSAQIELPVYARHKSSLKKIHTSPDRVQILNTYFFNNSGFRTEKLKSVILKHKLKEYICSIENCNVKGFWNGKGINLDLDHINGDNKDNSFDNLRFLCPNCHSQTDTYKARNSNSYKTTNVTSCLRCKENSKSGMFCRACKPFVSENEINFTINEISKMDHLTPEEAANLLNLEVKSFIKIQLTKKAYKPELELRICKCGKNKNRRANVCIDCYNQFGRDKQSKATYPSVDELLSRIEKDGYEVLSRELGVSGNAIRKHLKSRVGSYPRRRTTPVN